MRKSKHAPGSKAERYEYKMRRMKKQGSSFDDLLGLTAVVTAPVWLPAKLILGKKKKK